MNIATFSERYGYSDSSVRRWANDHLIPGAERIGGIWDIPEGARPRHVIRKKANRTVSDNAYDFLKALHERHYVDAEVLLCTEGDYLDVVTTLVMSGLIRESEVPADGRWNTGYVLTEAGVEQAERLKPTFKEYYRTTISAVAEGATSACLGMEGN